MLKLILELFGGIIIIFAIGWILGHILKLDKAFKEMHEDRIYKH